MKYITDIDANVLDWNLSNIQQAIVKSILLQEIPEELALMAERYEKHKKEREMARGGEGRQDGCSRGGGRRDGRGRGGWDGGQNWRF